MLNAVHFLKEGHVDLQTLLDGGAAVDDGGMVAPADELSNARTGHLRVLLCQIHRHLTGLHIFALAALAEHVLLGDTEVAAYFLEDVVDGERVVVCLHGTLDDALGQMHVNMGVVDDAVGHERVDDAL